MLSADPFVRMKRPLAGQKEEISEEERPEFDLSNPLCPGVQRPSGKVKNAQQSIKWNVYVVQFKLKSVPNRVKSKMSAKKWEYMILIQIQVSIIAWDCIL